ncbi:hypothetical protein JAAARDRAFT_616364 [Jaapia argillacea MUCL 33604]|uniref:Uncharacterized protein n=1 Tax=Jaapia argillacea MUCL 33604 TaxID=933084 RepID=A0A067PF80_9AGAM|nr:hypothetical protein JAAARDRAFT_616364 [Jaapia argillacea MUCL 33604]
MMSLWCHQYLNYCGLVQTVVVLLWSSHLSRIRDVFTMVVVRGNTFGAVPHCLLACSKVAGRDSRTEPCCWLDMAKVLIPFCLEQTLFHVIDNEPRLDPARSDTTLLIGTCRSWQYLKLSGWPHIRESVPHKFRSSNFSRTHVAPRMELPLNCIPRALNRTGKVENLLRVLTVDT